MPPRARFVVVGAAAAVGALLVAGAPVVPAVASADLTQYVDPMIGTAAPGFVFPGADMPFGMVQNSPDTTGQFAYSGYLWTDPVISGFSLVHLSGPGVKKAGDIPFTPWVGPLPPPDPNVYASTFDHSTERASPGWYEVQLGTAATKVELTSATHAALQRYTFPPSPASNVLLDIERNVEGAIDGHVDVDPTTQSVSGWTRGRYTVYFAAQFDRAWTASAPFGAHGKGAALTFDTTASRSVTMRVGISFVSVDGARKNLAADAPDFDLAAMHRQAVRAWDDALSAVVVHGGTVADRRVLYTSLYHAQLHPNVFEDVDGSYLGFDGQVHAARGHSHYANFSLWDTYKAEDQLLATIAPDRYRDMLLSLLDDYQQGGKLPRWGEENIDPAHMSGDPAISMVADGACRGLLTDAEQAALEGAALDLVGRRPPSLAQLGYLPGNPGTTLEYGVADFSLALLADRAGDRAGAAAALVRSGNWQNVFDPTTQWVRPRNADGSWATPFDPTDETGFQEGNSWQYSWLAPHDGHRLLAAMGGDGPATQRLDQLFAAPAEAQTRLTGYGTVYRAPQYAPGNEHDIQVPWMYAFAGQQWKVADELRNVQQVFRPTVDGLPGNDDLGGLSSWQVFSVLGFGPVIPGAPLFVVGSPLFDRVSIRVPGGRFTIEAPGASVAGRFVQSATLDGSRFDASWLPASAVRAGGVVHLDMGAVPNTSWGTAPPPSVDGTGDLGAFGCRAGGDRLGGRAP